MLTATLTDATSGAAANVTYKSYTASDGTTETEFKASVTGADANTTLDVAVDGTVVGQITTDDNGAGSLELSSNPDDSDEQQLPADFPTTIADGSAVTVGLLSGTLAVPTSIGGGCHGGDGGESDHTRLSTPLTDSSSSATGGAVYSTHTYDGTTTTRFAVRVRGATADSTLDVAVDGTVVGQIMTDGNGNGSLVLSSDPKNANEQPLPADFPTVTDGSTVTVGSLSGTMATGGHGFGHFGHFGRRR